jgi:hypothetical protein
MLKYLKKLSPFTIVLVPLTFLLFSFDAQVEKKPDQKDLTVLLQENVPNFGEIYALTIEEVENLASTSSPNFEVSLTAKFCHLSRNNVKHLFNSPG